MVSLGLLSTPGRKKGKNRHIITLYHDVMSGVCVCETMRFYVRTCLNYVTRRSQSLCRIRACQVSWSRSATTNSFLCPESLVSWYVLKASEAEGCWCLLYTCTVVKAVKCKGCTGGHALLFSLTCAFEYRMARTEHFFWGFDIT